MKGQSSLFDELISINENYISQYKSSPIITLINSTAMTSPAARQKLLDCMQVLSNYFQRTLMLRAVYSDDSKFFSIAQQHLEEEFGHNLSLMADRNYRESIFDPILEGCSAWFAWKMLTLDNIGKTLLIHFILEASAHVFFTNAYKAMHEYGGTDYFKIHSELDAHHETMGFELLKDLREAEYLQLFELQKQGWAMVNAVFDQIAKIVDNVK